MDGYCTLNSDASVDINNKIGAYALWIKTDSITLRVAGKFKSPVNDPNKAEIMAVINGMHLILNKGLKVRVLVVNTDNLMCRDIINGKRKVVPKGFTHLFSEIKRVQSNFPKCYAKRIKGHTDINDARHFVNRWCDKQAKRARKS